MRNRRILLAALVICAVAASGPRYTKTTTGNVIDGLTSTTGIDNQLDSDNNGDEPWRILNGAGSAMVSCYEVEGCIFNVPLVPQASTLPTQIWDDSQSTEESVDAQIQCNATDTTSASEDVSCILQVLIAGTLTTVSTFDLNGITAALVGKVKMNGTVNDNDCTGDQAKFWYDTTDSRFEFCDANTGTPKTLP